MSHLGRLLPLEPARKSTGHWSSSYIGQQSAEEAIVGLVVTCPGAGFRGGFRGSANRLPLA